MAIESPNPYPDIPGDGLKHDWDLLDRYQAFSTELLRMSLSGIGAVGFLITALAGKDSLLKIGPVPSVSRHGMAIALIALGLAAGAALAHRFASSDSMACHISMLRMQLRNRSEKDVCVERAERNRRFKQSGALLAMSSGLLGFGALALVVAFIGLV